MFPKGVRRQRFLRKRLDSPFVMWNLIYQILELIQWLN